VRFIDVTAGLNSEVAVPGAGVHILDWAVI
jgi:hypothetical protein